MLDYIKNFVPHTTYEFADDDDAEVGGCIAIEPEDFDPDAVNRMIARLEHDGYRILRQQSGIRFLLENDSLETIVQAHPSGELIAFERVADPEPIGTDDILTLLAQMVGVPPNQ